MTKARVIIRNALTFGLNRLSPGEQEDPDLFGRCLDALTSIMDEINGGKALLWREVLTASTPITGTSAQLGVDWPALASGDEILGASVRYAPGLDQMMAPITVAQYQEIAVKALTGAFPQNFAHDGAATLYLYPAAVGHVITLRTKEVSAGFADLDTDYVMPKGWQSALEALLAEKMSDTLVGSISPKVARDAARARRRLASQSIEPAIINGQPLAGRLGAFLAG